MTALKPEACCYRLLDTSCAAHTSRQLRKTLKLGEQTQAGSSGTAAQQWWTHFFALAMFGVKMMLHVDVITNVDVTTLMMGMIVFPIKGPACCVILGNLTGDRKQGAQQERRHPCKQSCVVLHLAEQAWFGMQTLGCLAAALAETRFFWAMADSRF